MSRIDFYVSDENHAKIATSQKAYLEAIAKRVESGDPLDEDQRVRAAGAIRAFAATIPMAPKRKQGAKPKFCHGSEALVYATYRVDGLRHGEVAPDTARDLLEGLALATDGLPNAMRPVNIIVQGVEPRASMGVLSDESQEDW